MKLKKPRQVKFHTKEREELADPRNETWQLPPNPEDEIIEE